MAEEVEIGRVSDFFARPVVAGIELTGVQLPPEPELPDFAGSIQKAQL